MEQQSLGGSFEAIVSAGSGSAWAPLAATQQRRLSASTGGLRHVATVDAATLQRDAAAAAASMQAAPRRGAVSMPASPRGGARARPPQPLNLGRVAGRLQLHQRAVERQSQPQQLSPVLEALLDSVPTPYAAPAASLSLHAAPVQRAAQEEPAATPAAPAAELTADDLVDLGNFTRWVYSAFAECWSPCLGLCVAVNKGGKQGFLEDNLPLGRPARLACWPSLPYLAACPHHLHLFSPLNAWCA